LALECQCQLVKTIDDNFFIAPKLAIALDLH
jgi:hypothetical protein